MIKTENIIKQLIDFYYNINILRIFYEIKKKIKLFSIIYNFVYADRF